MSRFRLIPFLKFVQRLPFWNNLIDLFTKTNWTVVINSACDISPCCSGSLEWVLVWAQNEGKERWTLYLIMKEQVTVSSHANIIAYCNNTGTLTQLYKYKYQACCYNIHITGSDLCYLKRGKVQEALRRVIYSTDEMKK